jgi:2',3'-cyclic-nucleotide 2'-phosphodiesterase (5'-nucleotidase family)
VARWATFINRHQNPDAAWLTVDAGNYVDRQGTGGCSSKCQFVVTSYRDLHYDVLNLGKQEVWMGYETLKAMLDTTKGTDFVSANLLYKKTNRPLAKPFVIKDYGKIRVGVIGLINEADFPRGTTLLDTVNLMVAPYIETARKYIPSLARRTDAVIVLAELPSQAIDSLAKIVPDIDLIISTGALRSGESLSSIGKKTRVLGTGSSGYNGHYAIINFDSPNPDSLAITMFQDPLAESYEEKGVWADRLAAFSASPASGQAMKIAPSAAPLPAAPHPATGATPSVSNVQPPTPSRTPDKK